MDHHNSTGTIDVGAVNNGSGNVMGCPSNMAYDHLLGQSIQIS